MLHPNIWLVYVKLSKYSQFLQPEMWEMKLTNFILTSIWSLNAICISFFFLTFLKHHNYFFNFNTITSSTISTIFPLESQLLSCSSGCYSPGWPHHSSSRVSSWPAQQQVPDWRGWTWTVVSSGSAQVELVQRHGAVEDVASSQTKHSLQLRWWQHFLTNNTGLEPRSISRTYHSIIVLPTVHMIQ